MRGEFIRGDGLVVPNSISTFGADLFMKVLLLNSGFSMYLGLCKGLPTRAGLKSSLQEPTIGTGGYARQVLTRSLVHWPTISSLDGVVFAETVAITFPATGNYSLPIDRIMLVPELVATTGNYISLSESFAQITIGAATPLAQRQFKYRLYLG